MPETLTKEEVQKGQDPSVTKQWDNDTPVEQRFKDFYDIADGLKIGIMGTYRNGVGPVGRAMAVAKRSGPDFLFLANANSQKFNDIEKNGVTNIYFHNHSNQDWISITGKTTTSNNEDPRIKEIWSNGTRAWFGDLGDGTHTGGPEDPRMKIIEVQPSYISYWKHEVGALGFMKEVGGAALTGGVANTGKLRQMTEQEITEARKRDAHLTSKA